MSAVAVLTPEALEQLVRRAVRAELAAVRAPEPTPEWLTFDGAATMLGVHRKTVARLVRAGELRAGRVGRQRRFLRSEVEALLSREGRR